jgi:hypothetical protein
MVGCLGGKTHLASLGENSYATGQVYVVQAPLFVESLGREEGRDLLILRKPQTSSSVPASVEDYEQGSPKSWPQVRGVIPKGARLRIRDIVLTRSFEMGPAYHVRAAALEGPFKDIAVELFFVSRSSASNSLPQPDGSVLALEPSP